MFEQEILATLPEQMFLSYREGIMKPDPRLWEIFFERTRLAAETCLFIDDMLENCEAARSIGVHAIHFKRPEMTLLDEISSRL
jgi:putative hydrolase of the HAD superfamily